MQYPFFGMIERKNLKRAIHFLMALCGGFFGVYAILSRAGHFGQAQTTNIVELICSLLGNDFFDAFVRLLSVLIFVSGMVVETVLERSTEFDLRPLAIVLDMGVAFFVAFIPISVEPLVALYPIFFVTAFQWCVFKGDGKFSSASIFCSNNLRQTTVALTESFFAPRNSDERREKREKAFFFGMTFLCFYIGVTIGGVMWRNFELKSIWGNLFFLSIVAILVYIDRQQTKKN